MYSNGLQREIGTDNECTISSKQGSGGEYMNIVHQQVVENTILKYMGLQKW